MKQGINGISLLCRIRISRGRVMKILITGMGNVGLMHGWVFSEGGVDVTHIVRKGSLAKYPGEIKLDVMDMRNGAPEYYTAFYKPKVVDDVSPADGYDLVMVATNHLQSADAVRQYKDKLPDAVFLMFCANWKGPGEIDELLSRNRYLWGYSVFSGAKGNDGVLYANIQKTYRIGELPGNPAGMLQKITGEFSLAGISPDIKENIIEWLWVHYAGNAGMLGTFLARGGMPSVQSSMDVWVFMVRAVKDALKVLERRGIDCRKYQDNKVYMIENVEEAAGLLRQGIFSMPHYGRTREHSHVDTNPEEMKCFYLDVLETGEQLGVDMPYLSSIKDKILGK
jgi:ketopantoate reductase